MGVRVFVNLLFVGMACFSHAFPVDFPTRDASLYKHEAVIADKGMVSTTNRLATEAGLEVLRNGGNAIDAAAAIQFTLSVVQPQSTGIGGGAFWMIYNSTTGEVKALDGREEAPEAYHSKVFCVNSDCMANPDCDCSEGAGIPYSQLSTGGVGIGVPGVVRTTARALEEFGTISFAESLQHAIHYAEHGFAMYETLYEKIVEHAPRLKKFEATREYLLHPDDDTRPKVELGQLFYSRDKADTLRWLAKEGPDLFYTGRVAHEIVEAANAAVNPDTGKHGLLSLEDLATYVPVFRKPLTSTYRGRSLYGMPPSSGGGVGLLQMLNLLEGFDVAHAGPLAVETLHRMLDVQGATFADIRRYVGDADFVDVPLDGLLDKTYARFRRTHLFENFEATCTPMEAGPPDWLGHPDLHVASPPPIIEHGTTHISVVDVFGNAVAVTTTLENNFGSAVVVPGRGFLLNNELTDFERLPADPETGLPYANAPAGGKRLRRTALGADQNTMGGKRPRSSMSPTFVFNGTSGAQPDNPPFVTIGSPGGSSIIGAVFNVLVNILDHRMDAQAATDLPRALSKNDEMFGEEGIYTHRDGEVFHALQARGFNFSSPEPTTATYGIVETVLTWKNGARLGAADYVREPNSLAHGY